MDLAKKLVETFREMSNELDDEAECYTVHLSFEDGEEQEFTFSVEEMENMTDQAMEEYLKNLIYGDFH